MSSNANPDRNTLGPPDARVCFIGGGNMARSLVGGLIARGFDRGRLVVADPAGAQLEALKAAYGVSTTSDNAAAAAPADVVVFAIKPQEFRKAASELRTALRAGALLISIAAGVRIQQIERWTGRSEIVRCMPNRPALQGCGVTGLFATRAVGIKARETAESILGAVGRTLWLERETDLDTVTAISGSGPAYFFYLIEILEQTGVVLGLKPEVSRTLAVETAYGAGVMAREASDPPAALREQVTSKGGTTEAALERLEAHGARAIFGEAVAAAARRSAELADALGREE